MLGFCYFPFLMVLLCVVMCGLQREIHSMEYIVKNVLWNAPYSAQILELPYCNCNCSKVLQELLLLLASFNILILGNYFLPFLINISKSSMSICLRIYVKIGCSASSLLIFIPLSSFSCIMHPLFSRSYSFSPSSVSIPFLSPPLCTLPYPSLLILYPSVFTQRALNFYQAADNSPVTKAVNQKWIQKIWVGHFPQ